MHPLHGEIAEVHTTPGLGVAKILQKHVPCWLVSRLSLEKHIHLKVIMIARGNIVYVVE